MLEERNTDMARVRARKRACHEAISDRPMPHPKEVENNSINVVPGGNELLSLLKWDFVSDICGELRPLSSLNYIWATAQFMLFFEEVEEELKRRRNPTWLRAYEEESMFMQHKRLSITMLVLSEEDDECMKVMAEVLDDSRVEFMDHVYWNGLEKHEVLMRKLENAGAEYERIGTPCTMM